MKILIIVSIMFGWSFQAWTQVSVGISSLLGISKYNLGDSYETGFYLCGSGGLYLNYQFQDNMAAEIGVGLDQFTTTYRDPLFGRGNYNVQAAGFSARYYYMLGETVPVFVGLRPGIIFNSDLEFIDQRLMDMETFAVKGEAGIGYQGNSQTTGLMIGTDLRNLAPSNYPDRVSVFYVALFYRMRLSG